MKSRELARRLSEIHSEALQGKHEQSLEELKALRLDIEVGDLDAAHSKEIRSRITETEVYILLSSPGHLVDLVLALQKIVQSIDTAETRKIETVALGLNELRKKIS